MRKATTLLLVCIMLFAALFFIPNELVAATQSNSAVRVKTIADLRTTNSDTYLLSDGSYECVIYPEDKYFINDVGEYVEIDNTIIESKRTDASGEYSYRNASGNNIFAFSSMKPSVLLEASGRTMSFSLKNSNVSPAIIGGIKKHSTLFDYSLSGHNSIAYSDALKSTDLVYTANSGMIKEYIILKNAEAGNTFTFDFITNGLTVQKNNNGAIEFISKEGTKLFELSSLFACDSAGIYTNAVNYCINHTDDDSLEITVEISKEYLMDPSRVFPILIDPSIIVTGSSVTYDSFVSSLKPTTNYYMSTAIRTGKDDTYGVRRTYIKFDIPSSVTGNILSAYLLFKKNSGSTPNVRAYRVLSNWSSNTITWNNKPGFSSTSGTSLSSYVSNNWYKIDTTSLVSSWVSGANTNYGFLLKDENESSLSQWTTFYSSEALSPNKPELHIICSEGQYLSYGSANKYIYVYPYSYNDFWQTALDQSRSNWNTSLAPVQFNTSSSSNNRVYVAQYDGTWYGLMTPLEVSDNTLVKFKIQINSRTIMEDALSESESNFVQSVFVHELGHTIWLADNPSTQSASIMKYTRDRNTMTNPSSYDISNVTAKY